MIEWYLKVVRDNYANFEGRARRSEYWYFALANFLIGLVLQVVDHFIGFKIGILGGVYSLAVFIPSLAVAVRRLHDLGKSGWFMLLVLIPIIGWIWLFVLMVTEGNYGPNQYGADPKNPHAEFNDLGKPETY